MRSSRWGSSLWVRKKPTRKGRCGESSNTVLEVPWYGLLEPERTDAFFTDDAPTLLDLDRLPVIFFISLESVQKAIISLRRFLQQ
jgi:hypothetical protein